MHRGDLLDRIVKSSAISIKMLTARLGYSRTTYYNHIRNKDLPLEILNKYGRALGYDFSQDIPEMPETLNFINTIPLSIEEAVRQRDIWKARYYELLEKHNAYLEGKMSVRSAGRKR